MLYASLCLPECEQCVEELGGLRPEGLVLGDHGSCQDYWGASCETFLPKNRRTVSVAHTCGNMHHQKRNIHMLHECDMHHKPTGRGKKTGIRAAYPQSNKEHRRSDIGIKDHIDSQIDCTSRA